MKNIILLTVDAARKDAFGIYGNKKGLTPTFDSLQDKSIIFTKGQTVGPYTQASFPGLLTSSYLLEYGQPKGLSPERTLISEPGVPAWEQDLEHTTERAGRRQDKEQMMSRLRNLGYM